jgi:hypothetical protein
VTDSQQYISMATTGLLQHLEHGIRQIYAEARAVGVWLSLKVQAATALLDRGWGKPIQAIEASAQQHITAWHLIAASAFEPGPTIDGNGLVDTPRGPCRVDLSKPALE